MAAIISEHHFLSADGIGNSDRSYKMGPPVDSVQLVYKWLNSMVYGRYNELVNGDYNGL